MSKENYENFKRRLLHELAMLNFSISGVLSDRGLDGAFEWVEMKKEALYLMVDGGHAAGGITKDDICDFREMIDTDVEQFKEDVKREDERRKLFWEHGD